MKAVTELLLKVRELPRMSSVEYADCVLRPAPSVRRDLCKLEREGKIKRANTEGFVLLWEPVYE